MSAGINADSAYNGHRVPGLTGNGPLESLLRRAVSNVTGPPGKDGAGGADRHHGNLISPVTPPPSLNPPSPQCPHIRVRGEPAEVKRVYWRLSGDDNSHFKVDGIKFFPFHVATGEHQPGVILLFFFFLRSFSERGVKSEGIEPLSWAEFPISINIAQSEDWRRLPAYLALRIGHANRGADSSVKLGTGPILQHCKSIRCSSEGCITCKLFLHFTFLWNFLLILFNCYIMWLIICTCTTEIEAKQKKCITCYRDVTERWKLLLIIKRQTAASEWISTLWHNRDNEKKLCFVKWFSLKAMPGQQLLTPSGGSWSHHQG